MIQKVDDTQMAKEDRNRNATCHSKAVFSRMPWSGLVLHRRELKHVVGAFSSAGFFPLDATCTDSETRCLHVSYALNQNLLLYRSLT